MRAATWQNKQNECAPAKTQIRLGIRPVWSESSLCAWRNLGSLATHWAHSEDSYQIGRMPRLIWVFAGCTVTLLVLSCRGSCYFIYLSFYLKNPVFLEISLIFHLLLFCVDWATYRSIEGLLYCRTLFLLEACLIEVKLTSVTREHLAVTERCFAPFVHHRVSRYGNHAIIMLSDDNRDNWAPSSEFVSSSIPSWQILIAHAQPFRGAKDLAFCLKVPLDSLLVWASSEGSGETARMRRLAWTFAARIGDKYQIRLTRSNYFSLCVLSHQILDTVCTGNLDVYTLSHSPSIKD